MNDDILHSNVNGDKKTSNNNQKSKRFQAVYKDGNLVIRELTRNMGVNDKGNFNVMEINIKDKVDADIISIRKQKYPLVFDRFIIPKRVGHIEYEIVDPDFRHLADLLVDGDVRRNIIGALSSPQLLASIISYATGAKNGVVQLSAPASTMDTIYNSVSSVCAQKQYNINCTNDFMIAMTIILAKVFKMWNILCLDINWHSIYLIPESTVDKDRLRLELKRSHIFYAVSSIPKKMGLDTQKKVSSIILASDIIKSFRNFLIKLQTFEVIESDLEGLLPRIRAVVMNKVEEYYKTNERGFLLDPNFINLSRNATIIFMALEQQLYRDSSQPYEWVQQDERLNNTVLKSDLCDVVDKDSFISYFSSRVFKDSVGDRKAVLLSKNMKFKTVSHVKRKYRVSKLNMFSDLSSFKEVEDFSDLLNNVISYSNQVDFIDSILSKTINNQSKPSLMTMNNINQVDVKLLAMALATNVFVNVDGHLIFGLPSEVEFFSDSTLLFRILKEGYTSDAEVFLFSTLNTMNATRSIEVEDYSNYKPGTLYKHETAQEVGTVEDTISVDLEGLSMIDKQVDVSLRDIFHRNITGEIIITRNMGLEYLITSFADVMLYVKSLSLDDESLDQIIGMLIYNMHRDIIKGDRIHSLTGPFLYAISDKAKIGDEKLLWSVQSDKVKEYLLKLNLFITLLTSVFDDVILDDKKTANGVSVLINYLKDTSFMAVLDKPREE